MNKPSFVFVVGLLVSHASFATIIGKWRGHGTADVFQNDMKKYHYCRVFLEIKQVKEELEIIKDLDCEQDFGGSIFSYYDILKFEITKAGLVSKECKVPMAGTLSKDSLKTRCERIDYALTDVWHLQELRNRELSFRVYRKLETANPYTEEGNYTLYPY